MVAMRRLAAVLVLVLFASGAAAGQTAPRQEKGQEKQKAEQATLAFAAMKAAEWETAARTHVAGTIDEPLKAVASWKPEHVALAVRLAVGRLHRLLAIQDVTAAQELAELTQRLLLGLSLHTDIAIAENDVRAAPSARSAVVLVDGQETRFVRRSAHWPIARQIAAGLATRPAERPRVVEWYRATAALMQQWGDCDLLGPHLEAGQALFENDPVLALYQGTLRQTMGDPRLHEYLRKRGSTEGYGKAPLASRKGPVPTAASRLPNAARVELGIAERELRRALTLDPTLHEARIRLAHVLGVLGNHRQAVDVVRPASDAALPPFTEFYAAVILGRSEEQLGRFAEAGAAYARAAARFPGAQSAEIGRSRAALALGQAADTLKILVDVVGPYSTERPDPWLDYLKRHDPDAETLLQAWRADLQ
jgi:tetratricopeptide (TPR) repeat protein